MDNQTRHGDTEDAIRNETLDQLGPFQTFVPNVRARCCCWSDENNMEHCFDGLFEWGADFSTAQNLFIAYPHIYIDKNNPLIEKESRV